jgi:diguanylate cyclase (GGDEF)-like protein
VFGALLLGKLMAREKILMQERQELRSAVTTDPLTQLLNRRAALHTYDALQDRRIGSDGTAMLCIDVDHFKSINDTHGHLRGDHVLVEIANRMALCLRPDDIFARMSGDEFVIVLDNLTSEHAEAVAQRCRKTISETPIIADGAEISASVSIGCAWLSDRPAFGELRTAADQILYRAKKGGRDRLAFEKINVQALPAMAPRAVAV